jgi:capsular exopolysaccharide synthesis family protein
MLSTPGGAPQRILVTSGEECEGKTVTAINLAHSLAKIGESVLLIDGDLRSPRLHQIKQLNNKTGLTTLLTLETASDEAIKQTIKQNGYGNLHILTAGERSVNPANLLSSSQMKRLLKELSAHFNYIIIDSPPALYFADSAILSTLVDAVILVVREGESSRQMILKTRKVFQSVGANLIGMVLNGVSFSRSNYVKYRYYEQAANPPSENDYQLIDLH